MPPLAITVDIAARGQGVGTVEPFAIFGLNAGKVLEQAQEACCCVQEGKGAFRQSCNWQLPKLVTYL